MSDVFEVGETVIATGFYGHRLTKGKAYVVQKYEAPLHDATFTWPAYVTVLGDDGTPVTGHAHRFRRMEAHAQS